MFSFINNNFVGKTANTEQERYVIGSVFPSSKEMSFCKRKFIFLNIPCTSTKVVTV